MLLAIDVGNTNMVFGLYDGDKLRGSFRISTNSERIITSTISPVRIRLRSLSRP